MWVEKGYSNHPMYVVVCLSMCVTTRSQRLQDFAFQMNFPIIKQNAKIKKSKDFVVHVQLYEHIIVKI